MAKPSWLQRLASLASTPDSLPDCGVPQPGFRPEEWKIVSHHPNCERCDKPFSWYQERLHCKRCGDIVCRSCRSQSIMLRELGYRARQKVCTRCFYVAILKAEEVIAALRAAQGTAAGVGAGGDDLGDGDGEPAMDSKTAQTQPLALQPDAPEPVQATEMQKQAMEQYSMASDYASQEASEQQFDKVFTRQLGGSFFVPEVDTKAGRATASRKELRSTMASVSLESILSNFAISRDLETPPDEPGAKPAEELIMGWQEADDQ
eukprot:gene5592-5561_t